MSNYIQDFLSEYGEETSEQLSSKLNIDKNVVKNILPKLTPIVLNGLKNQKDNKGGAARVDHILNKYGDKSALGSIPQLIASKLADKNSDAKLGGLLGDGQLGAIEALGNRFNLPSGTLNKMIPAIAPIILASLSKRRDTNTEGISGIASLLDSDGDGSIIDDIASSLGGLKSVNKSGILNDLIKGFSPF